MWMEGKHTHLSILCIRDYFNEDLLYIEKQKVKQSESEDES